MILQYLRTDYTAVCFLSKRQRAPAPAASRPPVDVGTRGTEGGAALWLL